MLRAVRGTRDLLPDDFNRYKILLDKSRKIASCYGYEEIATPIFEFSDVFIHLGASSDVVTKEMYTFFDKKNVSLSLRPEGTAGIVRAVISNGLIQFAPLKYFYSGPMFRYDRPQKGRYRQFHQLGVELLGVPEYFGDVEVISLAASVLEELGVLKYTTLEINSLGDFESRKLYVCALLEYLKDYSKDLSDESKDRLQRNPLRILDSKDVNDKQIIEKAPLFDEYLNNESKDFFAKVLEGLDSLNIVYKKNLRLVRGLDYYCHTAFEFTTSKIGTKGEVLAGGRYNGLVKSMGGPDLSGVGWAAGVERLLLMSKADKYIQRPIFILPLSKEQEIDSLILAEKLRKKGFYIELGFKGSIAKKLKRASKMNAKLVLFLGDEELKKNEVTVRKFDTGEQELVSLAQLDSFIARFEEKTK